jgi:uncharacterized membrane protein YgcG
MVTRWLTAFCMALVVFTAHAASAAEVINAFDQAITLDRDGSMLITETIAVNSEGDKIRHGIFRDFPLTFRDAKGKTSYVDFRVQSVEQDGAPAEWKQEGIAGGARVYVGSADTYVSNGPHTYRLTYRTDRQYRYFDDHGELYWNVTGNGWLFPILRASATVALPDGVTPEQTAFFTGPVGATGQDARVSQQAGKIIFTTTRPLRQGEGLTIAVKLAKDAIAAPTASQQQMWFIEDNLDIIIAGGGLILVFAYYLRSWFAVGRDPPRGVMVPRWDPPDGISPALVNYIDNKGFSGAGWTALSATALDLAVRGYVVLEDLKNSIVIRPGEKAASAKVDAGEKVLMGAIGPFSPLVIDEANGTKIQKIGEKFRNAVEREHRGEFYKANTLYVIGGVILSVFVLGAIIVFGRLHENALPLIIVPAFLSIFGTVITTALGRVFRRQSSLASRIMSVVVFAFMGFVAVSIFASVIAAAAVSADMSEEMPLLVAIVGIFAVNFVFFFLMGAPTPIGRKMMDGIDGLRQYLTLAEKDRMNMAGAPTMSPQHFEKLLPYAVALGVEKPWSRTFETWLAAAAGGAAAAYAPVWYIGSFGNGNFSDRIGGFSSSMASTIASTIPAPVSSSSSGFSGGGGSSGGGGGGGGGGGW